MPAVHLKSEQALVYNLVGKWEIMDLNIWALAMSIGFITSLFFGWCVILKEFAGKELPFRMINEIYLGVIPQSFGPGLLVSSLIGLIDGGCVGVIIALIYNAFR